MGIDYGGSMVQGSIRLADQKVIAESIIFWFTVKKYC